MGVIAKLQETATNQSSDRKNNTSNPYLNGIGNANNDYDSSGQFNPGTVYGDGSHVSFDDILRRFAGNSDFNQLLNAFGISLDDKLTKSQVQDWNKQLLDLMLQNYVTREQRDYNKSVLDEQRQYDNPTNQLARLMGSGISRDAAISMLSGAGAGAAGAGSALIGQPAAAPTGIAASQSALNGAQRGATIANTVFNGIQTVASLCGAGINIAQAIPQVQMLNAQNTLSQDQLKKYQATNEVTQTLGNLVTNGVVSYDELSNAEDARAFLSNNKDNPNIKPLFDSGAYDTTFGSTLGNQMFSNHWDNVLKSRKSGDLMETYARQEGLKEDLLSIGSQQARRDFFMSFQSQLRDLMIKDNQINLLWQQYRNGEVQIKINGQILAQERYKTKAAQRNDYTEGVQFTAFKNAVEGSGVEEPVPGVSTGMDLINYNTWNNLYGQYLGNLSRYSDTQESYYRGPDGTLKKGTNRQRYADFLNANVDAAVTGAFVQDLIMNNRLAGYTGETGAIYQFFDLWSSSGAGNSVQSFVKTGEKIGDAAMLFVK